jgi:hypothetical protein
MSKIQKALNSTLWFSISLLVFIVVLFIVLSPKVSSLLIPYKNEVLLNEFIQSTKAAGEINPQAYWQFREFYSPGHFMFARAGITTSLIENATGKIGIKYDQKKIDLTDLLFSSQRLSSLDMLTKQSSLSAIFDKKQFKIGQVIFMSKHSLIYQEDAKTIKIVFLLPNNDMKMANGFFDDTDIDKKITEGENWFNITSITKN